jgi:ketosteroid isomerase-like protein
MSSDTAALLHTIYTAYREKRLLDVLDHLDESFCFIIHLPEDAIPGGDRPRDKTEAHELLQYIVDTYEFLAYDPGPIIASAGHATAQPRIRFKDVRTGKVLDTQVSHTWQFKDGKALRLEERHDVPRVMAFIKSVGGGA